MAISENEFQEALRLRDSGKLSESVEILSRLAKDPEATATVFLILGQVWGDLSHPLVAVEAFRIATQMKPRAELASLGLFHALWKVGRTDEAFCEMRRFLILADSPEYKQLIADMNAESANDGDST